MKKINLAKGRFLDSFIVNGLNMRNIGFFGAKDSYIIIMFIEALLKKMLR